jgi:hypothetical protein
MALIRCPIHKIPYNEANPRGCPACAAEKKGKGESNIMRELARMSRTARPPGEPIQPPVEEAPPPPPLQDTEARTDAQIAAEVFEMPPASLLDRLRERRTLVVGALAIVALAVILFWWSRPNFIEQPDPPLVSGDVRPFPVDPDAPISMVFGLLGAQAPHPVPEDSRLARYSYGSDLQVDALNQIVYAITIAVPNRSWHGLQVGMPERNAAGTLALLGTPQDTTGRVTDEPIEIRGFTAYPSLDERPLRVLRAEVRPPNGCYDVLVDLKPRAEGLLLEDGRRYAVVGRDGAEPDWVVTGIRIVNRAIRGPYAAGVAC